MDLLLLSLPAIFLIGIFIGYYKRFFYSLLAKLSNNSKYNNYESLKIFLRGFDPSSLISMNSEKDIEKKRSAVIKYIWKSNKKTEIEFSAQKNIIDPRYSKMKNLMGIDKLTTQMKYSINSIAYLFHPLKAKNELIIYHEGHNADFIKSRHIIQELLSKGYSVLAFSMPLSGMNSKPTIFLNGFGKTKLESKGFLFHNVFQYLEAEEFSTLRFFLDPIIASLNYAEKNFKYSKIYAIGPSGGGWTIMLASAVDQRIIKSYPIAGSYPLYLRAFGPNTDIGDYEQNIPAFYKIANELELYILGSYGKGRKQAQIYNKYDPCCFGGEGVKTYSDPIKKFLAKFGKGSFIFFLDDTHNGHKISKTALKFVLNDISKG